MIAVAMHKLAVTGERIPCTCELIANTTFSSVARTSFVS